MFGGGISVWSKTTHDSCSTRHADDRSCFSRNHDPCCMFTTIKAAVHMNIHRTLPFRRRSRRNGTDRANHACIVVHDVQLTEMRHRGVDHIGDLVLYGHITMYINGCITKFIRKCLPGIVLNITHDNFATFFNKPSCRACTKPTCSPCYRSNFSL